MGLLTLALLIDITIGDPDWLWRRIPHPVVIVGKIIDWFEKQSGSDGDGLTRLASALGISRPENQQILLGSVLLIAFLLIAVVIALHRFGKPMPVA